jgi:prephenate dehydrogenase
MTIQITIIGLGQVGASFGLALAKHKDKMLRYGHDPEPTRARKMEKEGAVDRIFFNLPESVRDADIVLLALPVGQIEDTLKYIAEDLRQGVVVIDTSPVHAGVIALAKKYLAPDRHFVSIYPVINPAYLEEPSSQANTPHADLFEKSEFLVAAENTTHPDALKLVEDLAGLLDAKVYISEPVEADGISARVELLPHLVSAALIHATIDQAGWNDGRRSASKAYAGVSSVIDESPADERSGAQFILNQANSLSVIDQITASLQELRDLIEDTDEIGLNMLLQKARDGHTKWVDQRKAGDWEKYVGPKPPSTKERIGGLFGIREHKKKNP